MKTEVAVVVGTRPELIKTAPIIRQLRLTEAFELFLIHTGQHYDDELSDSFFKTLDLPNPDKHLGVGSDKHHIQSAHGLERIGDLLIERTPGVVVAEGDTNAVLSAAIATSKLSIAFAHVEAGIRSYDRSMPEEINRVIADHIADLAFAPTETAKENLAKEGITNGVYMTGNTIVDACLEHHSIAERASTIINRLGLVEKDFLLATIHRERNVNNNQRLADIIHALDSADVPVILPAHPRTKHAIETQRLTPDKSLRLVAPLDYLDFLKLLSNALLVVTDSGGVQEEAAILEVPCLTVRPNTERPETIEAGVNRLVSPDNLAHELETLLTERDTLQSMTGAPDLYGDGNTGERIVSILYQELVD